MLLIGIGSLYKIAELSGGGEVVARGLGGRRVLADTHDLRERVLLNVVEEMAIASGTPVPPVFLLDDERAINAFAAGTSPQNAVVAVTRGSIDTLSRDELQGVIAHEFSHILNGDMRLNLRLIGLLNGILLIAMIGYFLMRSSSSRMYFSGSSENKKGGNPLPLLGLCLYVIGYVGVFFGHLIKSAVSRQREFLADASAVQFTRLPDGIAGAEKDRRARLRLAIAGSARRGSEPHVLRQWNREPDSRIVGDTSATGGTDPPHRSDVRRSVSAGGRDRLYGRRCDRSRDAGGAPRDPSGRPRGSRDRAQSFAFEPAAAVAQIGALRSEHLDYASELVASLPQELLANVRNPLGAVAAIYALLLADVDPTVRAASSSTWRPQPIRERIKRRCALRRRSPASSLRQNCRW